MLKDVLTITSVLSIVALVFLGVGGYHEELINFSIYAVIATAATIYFSFNKEQ